MNIKRRAVQITIAVIVIMGIIYYTFNPEQYSFFPKCPFHYLTGYNCPGCGSQRAIHHLLNLKIEKAFKANPLMILALPYIGAGIYFEYFGGKTTYPRIRKKLFGKKAATIALTLTITYWIGRNIYTI